MYFVSAGILCWSLETTDFAFNSIKINKTLLSLCYFDLICLFVVVIFFMGFPVGYTEIFSLPKIFVHALSFLGFFRCLIVSVFNYLGLSDFLETDTVWTGNPTRTMPEKPPVYAILIREILPVIKYEELVVVKGDPPEGCAVCLYEFEKGEEIRWLRNCRHVFHRTCLDRWMDHDQVTCPLCRTPFVPDELQEEFNQRLWAASGIVDFYSEYSSGPGL